jgi:hypothetical protein
MRDYEHRQSSRWCLVSYTVAAAMVVALLFVVVSCIGDITRVRMRHFSPFHLKTDSSRNPLIPVGHVKVHKNKNDVIILNRIGCGLN